MQVADSTPDRSSAKSDERANAPDVSRLAGDRNDFPSTDWYLVACAGQVNGAEAWSILYKAYWQPIYSFLLRRGADREAARDITQGFFASLLPIAEKKEVPEGSRPPPRYLARLDPAAGPFHSWLQTAARNYLCNELKAARRQKRGGGIMHVCLDDSDASGLVDVKVDAAVERELEKLLDQRRLVEVVGRARASLCDRYTREGKQQIFSELTRSIWGPDGRTDAQLSEILAIDEGYVRTQRFRLKKEFFRYVQSQIPPEKLRELLDGPD